MPLPSLELIERYLGVSRSAVLVLIPVGIVFVAILLWAGNWRRSLPFLAGAACYWTLLIAYSFLNVPIFWTRTALPGLVPLLGFASLQLASVRTRAFRRVLVFGLLFACWRRWPIGPVTRPGNPSRSGVRSDGR